MYDDGTNAYEYMTRVFLADQSKEHIVLNTVDNNENNTNIAKGTIDNNYIAEILEKDKGKYFVKKTGSKSIHSGYKMYRNGSVITTISDPGTTTYDDNDLAADNYNYYVTATYTTPTGESDGSNTENVTIQPPPVGGTATAASSTICSGSNTTITLASSTGSIQWEESANGSSGWANVTNGSGGTTSSYTTDNLTVDNYYRAALSETGYPDEYSNTVHITVIDGAPEQPSAITGEAAPCSSASETYSVTNVSGVDYEWNLPTGWTGSSTTNSIEVTVGSDGGTISVTPSNECGDGDAITIDVTVGTTTVISDQPDAVNANVGDDVSFSIVADGDNLTYQWKFEGTNIDEAEEATYQILSVEMSDAGTYSVNVTGTCGEVLSDGALLTITTSIEELNDLGINIYPNPSAGIFNISYSKEHKNVQVIISDISGKIIYSETQNSDKNVIDLSSHSSGVYLIRFNIDKKSIITPIIIE